MKRFCVAVVLMLALSAYVIAIDIPRSDSARLDIVSRTSFGINLDKTYQFGLNNELTQLDLVFGLAPYQKVSNRLSTDKATGFINVTLFNLDLIKVTKNAGYNSPGGIGTNRYQTGEFLAGIAKGPWLIQLNASENEPFASPWNKGLEYVNDGFKLSWAYLDSMVDVRRIYSITGVPVVTKRGEENMLGAGDLNPAGHETMNQIGFDTVGNIADRFGQSIIGEMVAVMYTNDNFGVNLKLGTQYPFDHADIIAANPNGLAVGIDSVITPTAVPGLKIFASLMTTKDWGDDRTVKTDPIFGGTRVGYTIPLNEEISMEPWAGLDIGTKFKDGGGVEKPGYEASFGFTMRWPGQGGWLKDYILNSDGRVFPGMSLGYKIYEEKETNKGPEHSIKFTLFEPKGDEGLFYGLGSEVIIDLINLTGATGIIQQASHDPAWEGFSVLATAYFDYELNNLGKLPGTLRPWTILYYDNLPGAAISSTDDRVNDMKVDLGINLENAIANTTFGFVWNTGSLIQNKKYGALRIIAEIRL